MTLIMVVAATLSLRATSQVNDAERRFEVSSVKRSNPDAIFVTSPGIYSRGVRFINFSLKLLLAQAYALKTYQIIGPAWMDSEYYDVIANVADGTSRATILSMLQNLLSERFQLQLRRETKEATGYALVVDKGGPKLMKFEQEESSPTISSQVSFSSNGHIEAKTISALCKLLSSLMERPVADMTGIDGLFDITLNVSRDELPGLPRRLSRAMPDNEHGSTVLGMPESGPPVSIFTAVKDLGLKLESRKVPMECIFVDRAEKIPLPN